MVKTITVIYGCHGSGKTTLAKNILGEGFKEYKLEKGIVSVSSDGKTLALGQYHNKTGGLDSLGGLNEGFSLLVEAMRVFGSAEHLILEGIFLSSVIHKCMNVFVGLKNNLGIKIEMMFLKTTAETSLRRTYERNHNVPNIKNIVGKVKRVERVFQKMAETGEFDCFVINTDHLTAQDVLSNFRMVSVCFRR